MITKKYPILENVIDLNNHFIQIKEHMLHTANIHYKTNLFDLLNDNSVLSNIFIKGIYSRMLGFNAKINLEDFKVWIKVNKQTFII